jgi:hypothetical protein
VRFFPIPPAVPEEHADVVRFEHHEPVALGFEAKANEIAIERDRSSEVVAGACGSGSFPKAVTGARGM